MGFIQALSCLALLVTVAFSQTDNLAVSVSTNVHIGTPATITYRGTVAPLQISLFNGGSFVEQIAGK